MNSFKSHSTPYSILFSILLLGYNPVCEVGLALFEFWIFLDCAVLCYVCVTLCRKPQLNNMNRFPKKIKKLFFASPALFEFWIFLNRAVMLCCATLCYKRQFNNMKLFSKKNCMLALIFRNGN